MSASFRALPRGLRLHDRYVIGLLLGTGRSSAVYEAVDVVTRSTVALKVLDPFLGQDQVAVERFAREAAVLRTLDHPNIIKVFDVFVADPLHVICMERFPGVDAKAYLTAHGPLSLRDALKVGATLAETLERCHRRGVLHRDVKPQNLLLSDALELKLVDFGISRLAQQAGLTKTGTILGTPEYLAPELFLHNRADLRSDIFSLGAVLYELLTGRPPVAGSSLQQVMTYHLKSEITPVASRRPDVPEWLAAVVHKCLRVDPSARYQNCFELAQDLRRGERALAGLRAEGTVARCANCRGAMLARLAFCHLCGKFGDDAYARGPYAVVVNGCDDPRAACEYLGRVYGPTAAQALLAALAAVPAVYAAAVSRETAVALVHDVSDLACDLQVVRSLPRQLRLPWQWLGLGLAGIAAPFVLLGYGASTWLVAAAVVATEAALLVRFWRKVARVVLSRKHLKLSAQGAKTPLQAQVAGRLARFTDPALKTLLARIFRAWGDLRGGTAGGGAAHRAVDPARVGALVERAFVAARAVEGHQLYLAAHSLSELRGREHGLALRVRKTHQPEALEALILAKAGVQGEVARYLEIQETHARLSLALLNLYATLERLREAPAAPDAAAADADLGGLDAALANVG